MSAVLRGADGAAEALMDEWLPTVIVWCNRLAGPKVDPEDAAHDAMVIVLTRLHTLREPARFPGWVFSVVRGVITQHRRRAWVRGWVPGLVPDRADPDADPRPRVEQREITSRVQTALEALSRVHREVIVLVDLEERTTEEAAALLGIPTGTVKSRLRVAREAFRRAALRAGLDPVLLDAYGQGGP